MLFFIDTKTHKIHRNKCSQLRKHLDIPPIFRTKYKFYINLGLHKNLESAVLMGISQGYINAKGSSCCCTFIDW